MLCASRLSETHALRTQTLSAEPGWVAGGPPGCGPALQPQVHDTASAATPSTATQLRLTTANHLPQREGIPFRQAFTEPVCAERPRLRYPPQPSRRSCRMANCDQRGSFGPFITPPRT